MNLDGVLGAAVGTPRPAVTLQDVHFSYPAPVPGGLPVHVLQGVTLDVASGEALAIMGPTSSGKSTLALILAGLAPEMTGGQLRGQVLVDGLDATKTPAAQLSTHLGLVFQEPERQLFNMTVADEVAFGLEGLGLPPAEIRQRMAWALARVGLSGLEDRAPWQLSGGQQKRLAIASILALRPPILILDEPMAGLDPAGRREVAAVLSELKTLTGATVIVFDLDAEFVARWANRVAILTDGQIALHGPPPAVFAEADRLRALGLAVPQMAHLASQLRSPAFHQPFLTAQEAAANLTAQWTASPAAPLPPAAQLPEASPAAQATADAPPAVALQDVSFSYTPSAVALTGVTLAIPKGQFVGLVGQNGSGKSTLARHLNGLLRAQSGVVTIDGQAVGHRPVGELARTVGYVFQNPDHQIFAPTVREEIAFGPRNLGLRDAPLEQRVEDALRAFDLQAVSSTPPAVLGYGLRRLVTIAAVWAMQPAIWVLDEPTTGLDARYTDLLLARLRTLHRAGHTILLITHDLRLVAEAVQRVVVLHQGRVALDGATPDVLANAEVLATVGLRPPPVVRLSALLAPCGFPHPTLTVEQFVQRWRSIAGPPAVPAEHDEAKKDGDRAVERTAGQKAS